MRYFIDCEFIEDGCTIDPISIGVVTEDGREFYAESSQIPLHRANDWVRANVLPHLSPTTAISNGEIAERLRDFVGADVPEFWSWCSAYDWVMVCQFYGAMVDKPTGWPSYCRDLQQELDRFGVTDEQLIETVPQNETAHNALADARWHRDIHRYLSTLFKPGDRVYVTDPALAELRAIMRRHGHQVTPNHHGTVHEIEEGGYVLIYFDNEDGHGLGQGVPYPVAEVRHLTGADRG